LSSQKKFDEIKKANQAAARKLVEEQFSSSSEDDDEDAEVKQGKILAKTFTVYTSQTDGDASELERTRQYMNEAFQSGAMTCLICIASVKRNQAVWSCCGCFCIFHLVCIQKWAKDSLFLVSSPLTDDDFGKKDHPWPCPKCRFEYKRSETPNKYYCYCGKVENPTVDPWLVPHSCGQICEREFKPPCGHKCLLLCHPEFMCIKNTLLFSYLAAQEVEKQCRCGKHTKRIPCHKPYLCETKCTKIRDCQKHQCRRKCCSGNCPPCDQVCGRTLGCRNHRCPSGCHRGKNRIFERAADNDHLTFSNILIVTVYSDDHAVTVFILGSCNPCPEIVDVKCNCGKTVIKVPCGRERTIKPPKCKQLCSDCLFLFLAVILISEFYFSRPPTCHHPTQEKHYCHFGRCPPCRQSCQKTLTCGHLCPVSCHDEALVKQTGIVRSVLDSMRKLTSADVKEKDLLTSCKNQCPKQLPCGHRCKEICHSGCCPLNCSQKVKLKCPCKRLKKVKEAEAKAAIEEEKRRQQAELEAFENKLKGRRKNKRRRDEVEIAQSSWQKYKNLIMLPVFGVAVVMVAWLMVYND
ncbi:hypothetical protein ASZ78_013322, partial [Callipepla squamata]